MIAVISCYDSHRKRENREANEHTVETVLITCGWFGRQEMRPISVRLCAGEITLTVQLQALCVPRQASHTSRKQFEEASERF